MVDDLVADTRLLERILVEQGYRVVCAGDGEEALEIVARDPPDLILSDVRMPKCDGFDFCRAMKSATATRLTPFVLMTASTEQDDRIRAIKAGTNDFVMKPIDQPELKARVRSLMQLKRFTDDLDSAEAVLRSLALMIEARDAYTDGHCQRLVEVRDRARHVASNLSEDDLVALSRGGYFHDIGKIALPDAILIKPGRLTPEESAHEGHPWWVIGCAAACAPCTNVRPIVRHHHERLDGSGYPDHLVGDEMPLLAQIIGIVDVYDALTTSARIAWRGIRPRRWPSCRKKCAGDGAAPNLVEAFISVIAV